MLTKLHYKTAQKLYNEGQTITICPSNLSPTAFGNAFSYPIEKTEGLKAFSTHLGQPAVRELTFKERCDTFKIYNCHNNETGYNLTYWRA